VLSAANRGERAALVGASVFGAALVALYAASTLYHAVSHPTLKQRFRLLDHSAIYLLIAGTYTPFALLLPPDQQRTMLLIVWIGAVAGVLFRVFWVGAPRWLYTPVYVALGWVAVFYLGPLLHFGGPAIVTLIAVGGLLYTGVSHASPYQASAAVLVGGFVLARVALGRLKSPAA
jgi:hemolysin III